ncbi:unnamed protein product, partial [Ectocarpus fasciculatus]
EPEALTAGDDAVLTDAPEVVAGMKERPSATASFPAGALDGGSISDGEVEHAAGEADVMSDEGRTTTAAVVNEAVDAVENQPAIDAEAAGAALLPSPVSLEPTGTGSSISASPEDPERVDWRDTKQAEDRGQQLPRAGSNVVADVAD